MLSDSHLVKLRNIFVFSNVHCPLGPQHCLQFQWVFQLSQTVDASCRPIAIDNTLQRSRNSACSVDPTSRRVKHLRLMRLVRVDIPMVMSGRSAGPETQQYQSWSEVTLLRDRITCKSRTNHLWSMVFGRHNLIEGPKSLSWAL